ncbi:MAG: alpha/beta fold hydrolase [Planctomycetota bacterium]|nr:MAG: alpha/beta fold hydrolase [Planctomycetota bacterium]
MAKRWSRIAAALLALAVGGLWLVRPHGAVRAESWEAEFKRAMASPDSNVRHDAILKLDPNDREARRYLYNILETADWYLRGAAMEVLARAQGEAFEDVQKKARGRGKLFLREGLIFSLGLRGTDDGVPTLVKALEDKAFEIRRAAAFSLARAQHRDGVGALIEAWKKEKDKRLHVRYQEALTAITGERLGPNVADWDDWWRANADRFVPVAKRKKEKGKDGKPVSAEKESNTVLRGVDLTFTESGSGGPLFVLPEYGYNKEYMRASLKALEGVARVFYIDLPSLDKFKNLGTVGGTGLPEYPIDKLCDAFDELRKQRKQERIAILGHGISGWVAMRYATRYPQHVSHLILVSSWSSGAAWGRGRDRVENDAKQRKDLEQEHYAQSLVIDMQSGKPNYAPKDAAEAQALRRMAWSCYFADRRNGLAWMLYPKVVREMGGCIIPQFNLAREKKVRVPTLIIYGSSPRALWTSAGDVKIMARHYGGAMVVACPNSNLMPMNEDYKRFVKALQTFFRKYKFRSKVRAGS